MSLRRSNHQSESDKTTVKNGLRVVKEGITGAQDLRGGFGPEDHGQRIKGTPLAPTVNYATVYSERKEEKYLT